MNKVHRIIKNRSILLFARVVSYISSFFFVIYVARCLGAEGFGILSFTFTFTGIFGFFANFGLSIKKSKRDCEK